MELDAQTFVTPWLRDFSQRLQSRNFFQRHMVCRGELACTLALLILQTFAQTAATAARLFFAASKLALTCLAVRMESAYEMNMATQHASLAFRSFNAALGSIPGLINPKWTLKLFKRLRLLKGTHWEGVLQRIWSSPHRNKAIAASAALAVSVVSSLWLFRQEKHPINLPGSGSDTNWLLPLIGAGGLLTLPYLLLPYISFYGTEQKLQRYLELETAGKVIVTQRMPANTSGFEAVLFEPVDPADSVSKAWFTVPKGTWIEATPAKETIHQK